VREEFGKGNDFAEKITYKSSDGNKPEDLLQAFRNSYNPRIAVTVDMIATGTDVKPLECVLFMRMVKSRNFFEQMKGRGVRVIPDDRPPGRHPRRQAKDHFVLVDAVGVTETKLIDTALQVYYSKPYAQRPTYADIKALADAIGKPPHRWTPEKLWAAYETLDESKVRGSAGTVLTNLVSLVRFTLGLDDELVG
jgi:type I site-specific restriction endonuclease